MPPEDYYENREKEEQERKQYVRFLISLEYLLFISGIELDGENAIY